MKVINVPQRSIEWHRWRLDGVSASVATVILGTNPYKTLWRLWAEKTGRAVEVDVSSNPFVKHGLRLEDRARQCCEAVLNEDFLLPACAASDESPKVLASFDGLTELNIPTELKCPCQKNYDSVVVEGEMSEGYIQHYPQVQQQIYVAGAPYGWLMFYSPADNGDHRMFKILRDDVLIANLLVGIKEFWGYVETDTPPTLDLKRDLYIPSDNEADEWIYHATDYCFLDSQIRGFENQITALKEKRSIPLSAMKKMMGDFYKADFSGVSITRFEKQGGVDYDKLLRENRSPVTDSSMNKYRKNSSTQYRVTITNKAMPRNIVDVEVKERLSGDADCVLNSRYF